MLPVGWSPIRLASVAAAVTALVLAGTTACESPTAPELLSFERLTVPEGATPSPQLIGGDGRLRLLATFPTPCEPYTATASFQFTGTSLRLVVSGKGMTPCPNPGGIFYYSATLSGLPSGGFSVRAVHRYLDVAWPPDSVEFATMPL